MSMKLRQGARKGMKLKSGPTLRLSPVQFWTGFDVYVSLSGTVFINSAIVKGRDLMLCYQGKEIPISHAQQLSPFPPRNLFHPHPLENGRSFHLLGDFGLVLGNKSKQ